MVKHSNVQSTGRYFRGGNSSSGGVSNAIAPVRPNTTTTTTTANNDISDYTDISQLFLKIGLECGVGPDVFAPHIRLLEQNFYYTARDLRNSLHWMYFLPRIVVATLERKLEISDLGNRFASHPSPFLDTITTNTRPSSFIPCKLCISTSVFNYRNLIGRSKFGTSFVERYPPRYGSSVLVKILSDESLATKKEQFVDHVRSMVEIEEHSNIVPLSGFCTDPPALITEYRHESGLISFLSRERHQRRYEILMAVMGVAVCSAFEHLHSHSFVHGDFTRECLVLQRNLGGWAIKVKDWGMYLQKGNPFSGYRILKNSDMQALLSSSSTSSSKNSSSSSSSSSSISNVVTKKYGPNSIIRSEHSFFSSPSSTSSLSPPQHYVFPQFHSSSSSSSSSSNATISIGGSFPLIAESDHKSFPRSAAYMTGIDPSLLSRRERWNLSEEFDMQEFDDDEIRGVGDDDHEERDNVFGFRSSGGVVDALSVEDRFTDEAFEKELLKMGSEDFDEHDDSWLDSSVNSVLGGEIGKSSNSQVSKGSATTTTTITTEKAGNRKNAQNHLSGEYSTFPLPFVLPPTAISPPTAKSSIPLLLPSIEIQQVYPNSESIPMEKYGYFGFVKSIDRFVKSKLKFDESKIEFVGFFDDGLRAGEFNTSAAPELLFAKTSSSSSSSSSTKTAKNTKKQCSTVLDFLETTGISIEELIDTIKKDTTGMSIPWTPTSPSREGFWISVPPWTVEGLGSIPPTEGTSTKKSKKNRRRKKKSTTADQQQQQQHQQQQQPPESDPQSSQHSDSRTRSFISAITNGYSSRSDVWSFGVVLYEFLTGIKCSLLNGNRIDEEEKEGESILRSINPITYSILVMIGLRPSLPLSMNPGFRSIIADCWRTCPSDRPTAESLTKRLSDLLDEFAVRFDSIRSSRSSSSLNLLGVRSGESLTENAVAGVFSSLMNSLSYSGNGRSSDLNVMNPLSKWLQHRRVGGRRY